MLGVGHLFGRFGGRESKDCWGLVASRIRVEGRVKRCSREPGKKHKTLAAALFFIPYMYDPKHLHLPRGWSTV